MYNITPINVYIHSCSDKKDVPGKWTFPSTKHFRKLISSSSNSSCVNSSSVRWCRKKWSKIVTERLAERKALERSNDIDRALKEDSMAASRRDCNVLVLGEPTSAFPCVCRCGMKICPA